MNIDWRIKLENKIRVQWVDIGKFICIFFVMLSHLSFVPHTLISFYTPFFLNGFFFLSGYVYKQEPTFKTHMVKKIKTLLVPWFFFSMFIIFSRSIFTLKGSGYHNLVNELLDNFLQIRGHNDQMWFVICLFMAFIPFYFIIKYTHGIFTIAIAITMSVLSQVYTNLMEPSVFPWKSNALPWHIQLIFVFMLYMVLGYYFRMYFESRNIVFNGKRLAAIVFFIFILMVVLMESNLLKTAWWTVRLCFGYVENITGIASLVLISKLIRPNKLISFVGQNTLIYFGLHGKIESIFETILVKFNLLEFIEKTFIVNYVACFTVVFLVIIILIIPTLIINRYFPFVMGKKYNIKKKYEK